MTKVALEPGDTIEEYEILEKVGGNMGLVFKARHRLLNKVVALKLLPADWIDPMRQARFQREMRVMGQLQHPNLVTAGDARIVGDWHLVAMEWIDGIDLLKLLQTQGRPPVAAACEAARQAALALQYVHEHGLIHRDIKPSNLMLTRSGTVKVIDMGLALTKDDTAQLTQTGNVLGTMGYCAPEQFRDASNVGIAADIYGLGCTLFHLLAGRSPYSARKRITDLMDAHLNEPFPSLLEARPEAPPALEKVLARMTAKDPRARFATPGEVAKALESFAHGADLKPFVPSSTGQGPPPKNIIRPERGATPRPKNRRAPVAAVIVLLLMIAGALLATKYWQRQPVATSGPPVVVLMDTTAADGIYDADNKQTGASNAREVATALEAAGVAVTARPEPLYAGWDRETAVIAMKPDLLILHRSSFHHSYNAVFNFGRATNGFAKPPDDPMWWFLYNQIGDDKLITVIGMIGYALPQTKFLIYSRGTDTNWLSGDYRAQWVRKIEERFPKLKARVNTMVIPNGYNGSFRQPETREVLRTNVNGILGLPDKRRFKRNEQSK